jgi:hypothetical protein
MIRVELDPVLDDYSDFKISNHYREMKAWCRENFGKNPVKGPKVWCTNYRYEFIYSADKTGTYYDGWAYYPSFFFADPKHAHWFRLRWSNGYES